MAPEMRVVQFDRSRFAELVARSYYSALNSMLQAKFRAKEQPGLSGAAQWAGTHEEVEKRLRNQGGPLSEEPPTSSPQPDPGFAVRDAFVRAMIALYLSDVPKPVKPEAVADLAQRLLLSPELLPTQMEGYDIALQPL